MTIRTALPIGRKLVAIGVATVGLALLVNTTSALISTFILARRSIVADVIAQSAIVADNAAAAVAFDDQSAAQSTLALLRGKVSVDVACLFDGRGRLFARHPEPAGDAICPSSPPVDGTIETLNGVTGVAPVSISSRRVGTLYLHGTFSQVWQQVRVQAVGAALGWALGAGAALLLMRRLHRSLVGPLSDLSGVATRVSTAHDYNIRATKYSNDEIGALVDVFNEMLAQVQTREADLSRVNVELSREIVERQRIENERSLLLVREREANRLKDEFLAAVSHELRTPLNAILGWAQLLEQPGANGSMTSQGLASISRNARAQARLIDDLLDISRIVSGKVHLKTEPVDLATAAASAVEVVRAAATAKSIDVTTTHCADCVVWADPERLQQVLWNLLSNAVKFTPEAGKVQVTVDSFGGECTIEVRDTGIGIAPDFLPHVFDRFRQADGSMTREHGGLGLGLAIVHELISLHGGTVTAASPGPGLGTSFIVRLPRTNDVAAAGPVAPTMLHANALAGARILVVDDDEDARSIAATALRGAGADVLAVGSPREALEQALGGETFSVLVCDVGMRGMDGHEVLRRIHEREALVGRKTPAIAMTAYASTDDVAKARASGFGWHVAKPVAVPDLIRAAVAAADESNSA